MVSGGFCCASLQYGFSPLLAPFTGDAITLPLAATTTASSPFERQLVAGLQRGAFALGQGFVGVPNLAAARILGFDGIAVIQEMLDGDQLGECRRAADMIAVVMRDHQVVDLLEPGFLGCAKDSLGVAVIRSGIAGVDQQRLPFGSDDESGAAAFNVHPIDVEIASGRG